MFTKLNSKWQWLCAAPIMWLPTAVSACEKCFGAAATNTPVTRGIGLAMLLLLFVTIFVMGGLIAFFVYMWRRARLFESGKILVTDQGNVLHHPLLVKEVGKSRMD